MIRTLVLAGEAQQETMRPWLGYLERTGQVHLDLTRDPAALRRLSAYEVVVAHHPEAGLSPEEEGMVAEFVLGGGGLVSLHCNSCRWAAGDRLRSVMGDFWPATVREGELVVDVTGDGHEVTRLLAGSFRVRDSGYVDPRAANLGEALLSTTWHSAVETVAFSRPAGRGRLFHFGLGGEGATYRLPEVQSLLYHGLRHAAGRSQPATVGVGLLGYGAIGSDHAAALRAVPGLKLRAICDRNGDRLAAALQESPGTRAAEDVGDLLADPDVEVVVVSTPPNTHFQMAQQVLEAGRHAVVEKPFCLRAEEADRLVELAAQRALTLTVFQNRRWDPDFLALEALIRGGRLGRVFHLEAFVGGFEHPCHYWHSDAAVSGGVIFDWGAHYLDWILQLVPEPVVEVAATRQKLVWHDVTNDDHFEVRMRFRDGTEARFLHSDIAAARKPKWYVLGTEGAVVGRWREEVLLGRGPVGVTELPVPVADLPCELHLLSPGPGGRSHDQKISLSPPPVHAFYRNLAGHLLAGEPLAVTPGSARRNIAVMEAAQLAADGGPQKVLI